MLMIYFFFLMIRRPPRSTQSRSSAASDVYKRQDLDCGDSLEPRAGGADATGPTESSGSGFGASFEAVSYTHLRAHETPEHLVCRLLLEKKNISVDQHLGTHALVQLVRASPRTQSRIAI